MTVRDYCLQHKSQVLTLLERNGVRVIAEATGKRLLKDEENLCLVVEKTKEDDTVLLCAVGEKTITEPKHDYKETAKNLCMLLGALSLGVPGPYGYGEYLNKRRK